MSNLKPSQPSRIFTQNVIAKWVWLSIMKFYSFLIFSLFCSVDFLLKRRTSNVKSQQERMASWFCQIQDFQDSSQGHLITLQDQNSKNYGRQIAHLLITQSCVRKLIFCWSTSATFHGFQVSRKNTKISLNFI